MPLGILCARRWAGWAVVVGMAVLVVLGSSGPAAGQRTWQGTPGGNYSWFDPMAWSGGVVPGNETVYINNGGAPVINGGAANSWPRMGQGSGQSGGIVINSGSISYNSGCYVGESGYGWVIQNGGASTGGPVYLGYSSRGSGEYVLNNGTVNVSTAYVGYGSNATASFKHYGGSNTATSLNLAFGSQSAASYTLAGGMLSAGNTYVGYNGIGTFIQTGGLHSLGTGSLYLAFSSSSGTTGVYQLSGAASVLSSGAQYVGHAGTGLFSQAGGTNLAESLTVTTLGRYDMTGGVLQVKGNVSVPGKMVVGGVSGAASVVAGAVYVGGSSSGAASPGTGGSMAVGAGGTVDVSGTLKVWGPGTITIKSGAVTASSLVNEGNVILSNNGELSGSGGGLASVTGVGALTVGAGSVVKAGYLRQGNVSVKGRVELRRSGSASSVKELSIVPGGSVVMSEDGLVWDYTGATPAGMLRGYLFAGRNGGAWDGEGLSSSAAAGDVARLAAVGYGEAAKLGLGSFGGVSVDATTVILKLTVYGDATMDGKITADDYARIDMGLARHFGGWMDGDFDYSGVVDAGDYLLLDRTALLTGAVLSPGALAGRAAVFGEGYVRELVASVPEPGGLLVAGGLLLVGGRRRG